jgi:ParB family chromosome partitioning protein
MNEAPVLIEIALIDHNPFQVRRAEDPAAVTELAANIEKNGLLQPPTVRPWKDMALSALDPQQNVPLAIREEGLGYQLAFGHTRIAAFRLLVNQGKEQYREMPCFVKELDDLQMFEMAVSENIQRRDLNPIERAKAMRTYMETFKKTSAETGEFFNCEEATVRGTVRLLGLPEIAQEKLAGGEITVGTARQLLVLARVAPDQISDAIKTILKEDRPVEKVIEDILDALAYKNKAIKMWANWRSGKPSAGSGLWDLDMATTQIAKYLQPLSVLGDVDLKLARKALPPSKDQKGQPTAPVIHGTEELKNWVNKLHDGLVSAEALIAQGADAEAIMRLDQLIHPPACTACEFHVKANNNHYCTWKACHSHKKEAWSLAQLVKKEKSLEIKALSTEEAHAGFVALDASYSGKERALVEAKDPNLRLHIKPGQYTHAFTDSEIVEIVTIAPEVVEAKKEEKKAESSRSSNDDWRKQYELRQKMQAASEKFEEAEVFPLFATLLDPLDNLGLLVAMAQLDEVDFTRGGKSPSRKEKLRRCRIDIMTDILGGETNEGEGPTLLAKHLQGLAKTWGLSLPKDWLEKAKAFEPETNEPEPVPAETKDE